MGRYLTGLKQNKNHLKGLEVTMANGVTNVQERFLSAMKAGRWVHRSDLPVFNMGTIRQLIKDGYVKAVRIEEPETLSDDQYASGTITLRLVECNGNWDGGDLPVFLRKVSDEKPDLGVQKVRSRLSELDARIAEFERTLSIALEHPNKIELTPAQVSLLASTAAKEIKARLEREVKARLDRERKRAQQQKSNLLKK